MLGEGKRGEKREREGKGRKGRGEREIVTDTRTDKENL